MPEAISLQLIQDSLDYNPADGLLRWKVTRGRTRNGQIAGSKDPVTGYIRINMCKKPTGAHRFAWAIAHKIWPIPHGIDHKNGDRTDNRLCNLRAANQAQNMWNRGAPRNSSTGIRGVRQLKSGKYFASIGYHYENIYLGCFETAAEAKQAYDDMARKLYGDFYDPC